MIICIAGAVKQFRFPKKKIVFTKYCISLIFSKYFFLKLKNINAKYFLNFVPVTTFYDFFFLLLLHYTVCMCLVLASTSFFPAVIIYSAQSLYHCMLFHRKDPEKELKNKRQMKRI